MSAMGIFDFVIVGGGSSGAALAWRLGRRLPGASVALLEAGQRDWHPFIHVPAAIIKLIGNPLVDWALPARPDGSRNGKVDLWPAGRVLGGSSSINGMLYVRAAPHDFDRWAGYGCAGWSAQDVMPLYRALECTPVGDDGDGPAARGRDGPLSVQPLRSTHPLAHTFVKAAQESGLAFNPDYNGATQQGVSYTQATQWRGQRFGAARAFLWPGRKPANVHIVTGTVAERLKFDGQRCSGVTIRRGREYQDVMARREVIVCAGTLATPKLLMLSGLGPAAQLKSHGLDVRADLPGVGQNLQEHPEAMVSIEVKERTYNMEINSWRIGIHAARWVLTGRGPATSPYPHAVAFLKSSPGEPVPDIQVQLGPYAFSFDENGVIPHHKPAISAAVNISYPKSRGTVSLTSADARDKPVIDHQLLGDDDDVRRMVAGCQQVRAILNSGAFAGSRVAERMPGPDVQSLDEWTDFFRQVAFLGYHPVGTARMGDISDKRTVVSPDLKVKGIGGLRVADASVMPDLISGNTNATAMLIGLKAADMIAAE